MARPLIATDVPGNRQVVTDGENGFLCEARSSTALADAFERFLALSPEQQRDLGMSSRRLVEDAFSEEKVLQAYLAELSALQQQEIRLEKVRA